MNFLSTFKENYNENESESDHEDDPNDELIEKIPRNYREAMTDKYAVDWRKAMQSEYNSLMENNTWVLTKIPNDKRPIKCKWVYATKKDNDGNILRFKARLVAKDYSQIEGIDYEETFAPVIKYTTIRLLLAIASKMDLKIKQMDVETAFLNGFLEEEIYMEQPNGYDDETDRCCKLIKSIYGLKQSSRVWNDVLNDVLLDFGLKRSTYDQCLYYLTNKKDKLYVTIYVDDILIFSNNAEKEAELKATLCKSFKMKDLGNVSSILGIRVTRNEKFKTISIDQTRYIKEILQRFNMTECKPVSAPLDINQKISTEMSPKTRKEKEEMKDVPYREAIGALLFVARITRADITFPVNLLSRYCENPGEAHWGALKRIMRYLKGSMNMKITYGEVSEELTAFSDADWASDLDERRSTTGYVFTLNGGAISWGCKKQPTVALSSTEAEYMAIVNTMQEAIWLRSLHVEIFGELGVINLNTDNKGAIEFIKNNAYSPRTKHIDIKAAFIREKLNLGHFKLLYRNTNEMPADVGRSKLMALNPIFGLNNTIIEK